MNALALHERLARTVERLETAYDATYARLARDFTVPPEAVTDPNGRPILLDALCTLATAQAALANLRRDL